VAEECKLVVNLAHGGVICERVGIADRPLRRMRGLLGRDSLPSGEGMLLAPAPSIHTAFMRFAIDAVFLDRTLRVVKLVAPLVPYRMAAARGAWATLELAAGEVGRRKIEIGDQLGIVEVRDQLGPVGVATMSRREPAVTRALDGSHQDSGAAIAPGPGAADVAFAGGAPTRVLVVAKDRRFRAVAAALLTQRGCTVTLGEPTEGLADLARREAADVVVLDAGVSLSSAAYGVAQIEALKPDVGVVVVGEEPDGEPLAVPVLAKWGSFEALYSAVEHARPGVGSAGHGR
jgi:uncharacterized membrane protein (UPF0127 family)